MKFSGTKRTEFLRWARLIVRGRDMRDLVLGSSLFADPAWDLILALYIATAEGRQVTEEEARQASRVSPTTATRWINELERIGRIVRSTVTPDGSPTFIYLTGTQFALMDQFFESLASDFSVQSGMFDPSFS